MAIPCDYKRVQTILVKRSKGETLHSERAFANWCNR